MLHLLATRFRSKLVNSLRIDAGRDVNVYSLYRHAWTQKLSRTFRQRFCLHSGVVEIDR